MGYSLKSKKEANKKQVDTTEWWLPEGRVEDRESKGVRYMMEGGQASGDEHPVECADVLLTSYTPGIYMALLTSVTPIRFKMCGKHLKFP